MEEERESRSGGWLRNECPECAPLITPKSLNVHCEWIPCGNNQTKELSFIKVMCYGNSVLAHQLSGGKKP